jgi:anaerobic ribonucleoside-triphosphate reductase activating protein
MKYHKIEKDSVANGIGIRCVLWVSGCSVHCKGCQNPQTWSFEHGNIFDVNAIQTICEELKKPYIAGLTLSGGHPLEPENIQECTVLCMYLKERFPEKTIWLYTGWLWEEISHMEIMKYIDVVVDGPYIEDQKDITLKWRGSRNQRVIDCKQSLANKTIVLLDDC